MNDIFISYAREDVDFVRKLSHAFKDRSNKDRSYSVWFDLEGLSAGEEYWPQICTAIAEAEAFLFVMSSASLSSPHCQQELAYAVDHHKRIVPIYYHEVDEKMLPRPLAIRQWQFFRHTEDFSSAFTSLLKVLDTDVEWVRSHTQWLLRAEEWNRKGQDPSLLVSGRTLREGEQWLTQADERDPQPTPLQNQYLIASRYEETKRRGRWFSWVSLGLVVSILFGFMAWQQRGNAQQQASIALAQQLVLQAAPMKGHPELSTLHDLLAIEAVKRFSSLHVSSLEAEELLRPPTLVLGCATPRVGTTAVAFSPDGRLVATAGYACAVRIWDPVTGQEQSQIPHSTGIAMMTFSPDGRYLATLDWNRHPHVWALEPDRPPQDIYPTPFDSEVSTIRFSPDGQYLATANFDGIIRVREFRDNREIFRQRHDGGVATLAFSRDSKYLATGGWNENARMWEITKNREVMSFPHPKTTKEISQIAFSPDGRLLATITQDPVVRLWNVDTSTRHGQQVAAITHRGNVTAVAFSDDGQYIATAGWDKVVRLWDRASTRQIAQLPHAHGVTALQFTKDSRSLVTGSYDRTARVWSVPDGYEIAHRQHASGITALAISPDDQTVVTGSYDPDIYVWNLRLGHLTTRLAHTQYRSAVALSVDEQHLATADDTTPFNDTTTIYVWNRKKNQPIATLLHDRAVALLTINSDGTLVAAAGWDGSIAVWQVDRCRSPNCHPAAQMLHKGGVAEMTFDPSGKYLLTAGWDKTTRGWEARNPRHYRVIAHEGGVAALAFSADGKQLATAGWDDIIRLWDTTTLKERASLFHKEGAVAVAFSPDGKFLASAGWDKMIHLWDLANQQVVNSLQREESITDLAFSPDGKYLATAGSDKIAREWALPEFRETIRLSQDAAVKTVAFSPNGDYLTTTNWQYEASQWIRQQGEELVRTACANLENRREEWKNDTDAAERYHKACQPPAASEEKNSE